MAVPRGRIDNPASLHVSFHEMKNAHGWQPWADRSAGNGSDGLVGSIPPLPAPFRTRTSLRTLAANPYTWQSWYSMRCNAGSGVLHPLSVAVQPDNLRTYTSHVLTSQVRASAAQEPGVSSHACGRRDAHPDHRRRWRSMGIYLPYWKKRAKQLSAHVVAKNGAV